MQLRTGGSPNVPHGSSHRHAPNRRSSHRRAPAVDLSSRAVVAAGRTSPDDAKSEASHRLVPVEQMHPGSLAVLRSLSAAQAADRVAAGSAYDASCLVVVDALGHGVSPDAYSDRFRALCSPVGVPPIRLHEVRHTLALMLHRAGEAPADVAALLGHTVLTHLAH